MIEFIEPDYFTTFYTTNQMSTDFTIRREPPGKCTQFGNTPSSLELLAHATDVSVRLSLFLVYSTPSEELMLISNGGKMVGKNKLVSSQLALRASMSLNI